MGAFTDECVRVTSLVGLEQVTEERKRILLFGSIPDMCSVRGKVVWLVVVVVVDTRYEVVMSHAKSLMDGWTRTLQTWAKSWLPRVTPRCASF